MAFAFPKFKNIIGFAKETLSEANGHGSFGRVSAGAIVVFTLFWITFLVIKTHTMPDLAGPTLFLSSGSASTYGANKVADAIKNKGKNDPSDPPDPKA